MDATQHPPIAILGFLCSLILCFSLPGLCVLDSLILDSRSLDTTPYTTHPRIGLALSGGGRGLVHLGVLRTFGARLPIAFLAGTSMGGLVAGATVRRPAR